ncbi:polyprenyl synthetase family protein [Bdellovibrio bacteriovorus]
MMEQSLNLKDIFRLNSDYEIDDLIDKTLLEPVQEFFSRPKKDLRGQLVQLGFCIAKRNSSASDEKIQELSQHASHIIEMIHAGSLVVDDIQDGSLYRRGKKTLHHLHGLPVALNAGNWLYFIPFTYIGKLDISEEYRSRLMQECLQTLVQGHYGQALDVGTSVHTLSQDRIESVSRAAMELKSGALVSLALKMGTLLLGGPEGYLEKLDYWGRKIGLSLQMFDDLGNIHSRKNPVKRCEDLKLHRIGHIFSVCSKAMTPEDFSLFLNLTSQLPQTSDKVEDMLKNFEIEKKALLAAVQFLNETTSKISHELQLQTNELNQLLLITNKLLGAYE